MNYPELHDLSAELQAILAGKNGANIYRMLMHSPNLAPPFTEMADAVMWNDTWPAGWREIVIVRVGHHFRSHYEIYQHERIGRLMGVSQAKLAACALGAHQSPFSAEEQMIVKLTDALVLNHRFSQSESVAALSLFTANQLADFVLTVGFYQLACNFLNVFDVQLEDHDIVPDSSDASQRGEAA